MPPVHQQRGPQGSQRGGIQPPNPISDSVSQDHLHYQLWEVGFPRKQTQRLRFACKRFIDVGLGFQSEESGSSRGRGWTGMCLQEGPLPVPWAALGWGLQSPPRLRQEVSAPGSVFEGEFPERGRALGKAASLSQRTLWGRGSAVSRRQPAPQRRRYP